MSIDPFKLSVSLSRRNSETTAERKIYPANLVEPNAEPALVCYGDLRRQQLADAGKLGAAKIAIPNMQAHMDAQRAARVIEDRKIDAFIAKRAGKWPTAVSLDDIISQLPKAIIGSSSRARL